jgi:hypothetical protein
LNPIHPAQIQGNFFEGNPFQTSHGWLKASEGMTVTAESTMKAEERPFMKNTKPLTEEQRNHPTNTELLPSRPAARGRQLAAGFGALLMAFGLVGCGTISGLQSADGKGPVNLSPYTKVVVRDFADRATDKEKANREDKQQDMKRVTREFADLVASETRKTGVFQQVSREGDADASTLLIGGDITEYERGSAAARLWVDMGAGSSYLDALLEFRQGNTGALVGTLKVNKNSWQTADSFMEEAAKKVAEELKKAKQVQLSEKVSR